ncbi:MAG: dynamin family protein, partial [Planctomycetota bacterium]
MTAERPWLEGEFSECVARLKKMFLALHDDLTQSEVEETVLAQLKDVIDHLDELFLLVICGEFNSGKSSVINALFGAKVCPEGPVPTTDRINVLKYSETPMERFKGDFIAERYHPFPPLKTLNIVDTPGTNSIVKQHQEITENFIPRADLVLFITSIDRPYSKSEQDFLRVISERWRKKIIFVLTKIDTKEPEEIDPVIAFIRTNCEADFGFSPMVIPLSPKLAYIGRTKPDKASYDKSKFQVLENYLFEQLTAADKLTLKLIGPIDSALRIGDDCAQEFSRRLEIIEDHADTIRRVEKLVNDRARAMKDAYNKHLLNITNLLGNVENRGVNFFEEKIHLGNWRGLMDRQKFKLEFEESVIRSFEKDLWDTLSKATDEVVRAEMSLWSDAFNEYNHWIGLAKYKHESLGRVSTEFQYNRDKIIDGVRQDWDKNLNSFNQSEQVNRILDDVGGGLRISMGTGLLGAGAIATPIILASGPAAIVVGVVAGLGLASIGIFLFPGKRKQATKRFKDKFAQLREELIGALQKNIDDEVARLKGSIFVKLEPARKHFAELKARTERLANSLDEH